MALSLLISFLLWISKEGTFVVLFPQRGKYASYQDGEG